MLSHWLLSAASRLNAAQSIKSDDEHSTRRMRLFPIDDRSFLTLIAKQISSHIGDCGNLRVAIDAF